MQPPPRSRARPRLHPRHRCPRPGDAGFTLPEVLAAAAILIIILGALSTMALAVTRTERQSQRHLDQVAGMQHALQQFALDLRRSREYTPVAAADCRTAPDQSGAPAGGYRGIAVNTTAGERIAYCWYDSVLYRRAGTADPQPIARGVVAAFGLPDTSDINAYRCDTTAALSDPRSICIALRRPEGGKALWTSAYLTGKEAP